VHGYVSNMIKSAKVSRAFGAQFVVFFQPTLYYKDTLSALEVKSDIPAERKFFVEMRERIRARVRDAARHDELGFVDLSDVYDGTADTVFDDGAHTTQESKALVAQEIYKHLGRYVGICG
jgi:hypothetical protein